MGIHNVITPGTDLPLLSAGIIHAIERQSKAAGGPAIQRQIIATTSLLSQNPPQDPFVGVCAFWIETLPDYDRLLLGLF